MRLGRVVREQDPLELAGGVIGHIGPRERAEGYLIDFGGNFGEDENGEREITMSDGEKINLDDYVIRVVDGVFFLSNDGLDQGYIFLDEVFFEGGNYDEKLISLKESAEHRKYGTETITKINDMDRRVSMIKFTPLVGKKGWRDL